MRINLRFSRRRLICLTGALFACFTLYIWYSSQEESNRIWILKREQYIEEYLENKQFVDKKIASIKNQACHVPSLNAFSPDILRFMGMRNITCDNVQYGSVTIDGLFEIKNPSKVITDVKVYYIRRAYHENEKDFRNKDYAVKLSEVIELTPNQKGEYGLQLIEDFVRVEMYVDNSYHVEFHAHVSKQTESEARKDTIRRNDVKGMGLDFVFVMIDSQSHANFDRQLMRTMRTLKADTNTVIFNGHTIVGDGTTAQIAAMFIGELEENLAETRRGYENAGSCDQYNFIFKDLHKAGYVTLYSEDDPFFSTFHYRLHGFDNPPTTWYTRPYWIGEIENRYKKRCTVLRNIEILKTFTQTFEDVPKLSLVISSTIGHNDINNLQVIDDDLLDVIDYFKSPERIDHTALVIFADHGIRSADIRVTIQGKLEERLPFLSMTMPPFFREQHNEMFTAMKQNSFILTNHFDIYATLQHMLQYPNVPGGNLIGQSLFTKIDPTTRKCENSGVKEHWCPCLMYKSVDTSDKTIQRVAREVVVYINDKLKSKPEIETKCAVLSLSTVTSGGISVANEKVRRFVQTKKTKVCDSCDVDYEEEIAPDLFYEVSFVVAPSGGSFEANAKVLKDGSIIVQPDISRTNLYGNQPACIMEHYPLFRPYCYCV